MNAKKTDGAKSFTGKHMAVVLCAFFAVVIAVNLTMARLASGTFGGVVVENSYVATQHFNRWLDEAEAQKALGWTAGMRRGADGRVVLTLTGVPEGPARVSALARHPLGRLPDQSLIFARQADGRWLSAAPLPTGRWRLRLDVEAGGHGWRHEEDVS